MYRAEQNYYGQDMVKSLKIEEVEEVNPFLGNMGASILALVFWGKSNHNYMKKVLVKFIYVQKI